MIEKLYMTEKEAAIRYGYSRQWFQKARWEGDSPPYIKVKRKVLYLIKKTDAWFADHGLRTCTDKSAAYEGKPRGRPKRKGKNSAKHKIGGAKDDK